MITGELVAVHNVGTSTGRTQQTWTAGFIRETVPSAEFVVTSPSGVRLGIVYAERGAWRVEQVAGEDHSQVWPRPYGSRSDAVNALMKREYSSMAFEYIRVA